MIFSRGVLILLGAQFLEKEALPETFSGLGFYTTVASSETMQVTPFRHAACSRHNNIDRRRFYVNTEEAHCFNVL